MPKHAILYLLTSALTLGAPSRTPDAQDDPADTTVEDIEVMRRLLEQELRGDENAFDLSRLNFLGAFGEVDDETRARSVREYLAARVTHSRAFHVPESGAFFALDLQVPVVADPREAPEQEAPAPADEWERVRREVRGSVDPPAEEPSPGLTREGPIARLGITVTRRSPEWRLARPDGPPLRLDPRAIDAAVDAVRDTLAEHGQRISGLDDDETITVAIHAQSNPAYSGMPLGEIGTLGQSMLAWRGLEVGSRVQPVRIVVQVKVGALRRAGGDAAAAREAVRFARY